MGSTLSVCGLVSASGPDPALGPAQQAPSSHMEGVRGSPTVTPSCGGRGVWLGPSGKSVCGWALQGERRHGLASTWPGGGGEKERGCGLPFSWDKRVWPVGEGA